MDLMIVISYVLCFSLSLLQTSHCASLQIQLQRSHEQAYNNEVQLSLPTLPRKLRVLTAEVTLRDKEDAAQDKMSHNNPKEDVPAGNTNRLYKKEQGVKQVQGGSKATGIGTWQEWVEGGDTSQYFTMDYSHVKRRRPIHNKSLPAGP